jgi:transposase-like protein
MAKGIPHNDQTKASVMAALLAGQSVADAAKQYHIPEGTVHEWKRQAKGVQTLKKEELSELVGNCLREFLTSIQVYATESRDPAYIKRQPASELAVLLGVVADKAFRILEAAEQSNGSGSKESDDAGT